MINIIEYTDNSGEFGSLKGCYLDLIWTLLLLHPTGLFANKLLWTLLSFFVDEKRGFEFVRFYGKLIWCRNVGICTPVA